MLRPYDLAVIKLIKLFAPNILVVGLQNDDSSPNSESVMTQAGKASEDDKPVLPVISVFRNPGIEITDGSMTKRASTAEGYSEIDYINNTADKLICMRATLTYTVDTFDVTRESAEEIATRLYFRLRNNPEIIAKFVIPGYEDKSYSCAAEIELEPTITNIRTNSLGDTQLYKLRFEFKLVNANLFDIISKELPKEIRWTVTAELS